MKKIVSIALTLVMAFAMALTMKVTTFAAETEAAQYTITAPSNGHTYEIYQIFTGDFLEKAGNKTLSNIKWGANGTGTKGSVVNSDVLDTINAITGSDQEKADKLKDYVNLESDPFKTVSNGASVQVPEGYYLIKDKDDSLAGKDEAYTTYLVKVVGNLTITPKADKPSSEKKVKDTNDTTGTTTGWQDSADYDIGDEVPFQLKGTVASNYDSYKTYKFVFHDKESAGLTFNKDSVKVYVDGNEITSGYTINTNPTDKDTFDVEFANLKDIESVHKDSVITVEYKATLNDKAVLGATGNPNEMHLEYSNNPNDSQGGETGKTPDDKVIVFTYKTVINKVDSDNQPLTGAEFTLEKKVKNEDGTYSYKKIDVVTAKDGTEFTFSGLDDGEYRLTETKTPEGYNTIDPITFTITASHDEESNDPKLTDLNGNAADGKIEFTVDQTAGSLTSNVVNQKGANLPETGGRGTTIMYLVGGVLVAGAVLLLITKRRVDADK